MILNNRYEFVLLFDIKDGNPNGDPDTGNLPRVDPETGQGLVTDICLKRKVRNFIGLTKGEHPPYEIYVKEKAILNKIHERAYHGIGKPEQLEDRDKKRKGGDAVDEARLWMCKNFFDIRTFGAVMSTGVNCGQVKGPVQLTFARSIEPIVTLEHTITRCAVATEAEAQKQHGDNHTMARKNTVSYGLYRCHGYVSAHLAQQTGFTEDDLALFWDALVNMFDHDRSAARGDMSTCCLYVFKHDSALGNAPARKQLDSVKIERITKGPARSFADYKVTVEQNTLPSGVTLLPLFT